MTPTLFLLAALVAQPPALKAGSQAAFSAFNRNRIAGESAATEDTWRKDFLGKMPDLKSAAALSAIARAGRIDRRTKGEYQWHPLRNNQVQITYRTESAKKTVVAFCENRLKELTPPQPVSTSPPGK